MSLSDNIHQLTSEHMSQAADGSFTLMPPLLAELRAASGSTLGASGSGSGGMGMIVNSKAVKLENEIRESALYEHFEMAGSEYRGSFTALIKTWPHINIDEWQTCLEHVTLDWIDKIRALLTRRRPPWRPTLDCPSCQQRYHGPEREQCLWVDYWDHENDVMAHPSQWSAGCDGCGAEWSGDTLKWLQAATRANDVATTAMMN